MAIVNANYEFVFVDIGAQGGISDGGIWQACAFKMAMDDGYINLPEPEEIAGSDNKLPFVLVGDDAFPLGPGLLKPFARRDLSYEQRIFNYRLSRARRVSENAFGILSNRFRVFLSTIDRPPYTVEAMVLAACTLHNVLRRRCPTFYTPPGSVDQEDANFNVLGGRWRCGQQMHKLGSTTFRNPTVYAKAVQQEFMSYFVGAGKVPWQDKSIFATVGTD